MSKVMLSFFINSLGMIELYFFTFLLMPEIINLALLFLNRSIPSLILPLPPVNTAIPSKSLCFFIFRENDCA